MTPHKVIVRRVLPTGNSWRSGNILLPICLGTQDWSEPRRASLADWVARHFEQINLLICDGAYKTTLQIEELLAYPRPKMTLVELTNKVINEWTPFRQNLTIESNILLWSDIAETSLYLGSMKEIRQLAEDDQCFAVSIERTMRMFLHRRSRWKHVDIRAVALCHEYIIREVAMFAVLSEMGHKKDIYPGSELLVLKEVIEGRHPRAPKSLRERVNIEFTFRRR